MRQLISLCLVTISLLLSLTVAEISLRLFYPKYIAAAEASYLRDPEVIFKPKENTSDLARHPDTGKMHEVRYGKYGISQTDSSNLSDGNLKIGFFGDSYTQNRLLPKEFVFSNVFAYLIRSRIPDASIYNFGVAGYGTAQSYLRYKNSPFSLSHVFYIACGNDLQNIYENAIFALDQNNRVKKNPYFKRNKLAPIFSSLHLTYLFLDAINKIDNHPYFDGRTKRRKSKRAHEIKKSFGNNKENSDLENSKKIYSGILKLWGEDARVKNAEFFTVLLPRTPDESLKKLSKTKTINLYQEFSSAIKDYSYNDIRFKNDWHWAESGNLLFAVYLYRFFEDKLDLDFEDEQITLKKITNYYNNLSWKPDYKTLENIRSLLKIESGSLQPRS